ncbi:MAG: winged helix-turn-helix domain-containing protein [Acidobacteria bacterium]|nr:winged helix-turn-helix domain-containing protein [Acidobacteriota bacterium]
MENSAETFIYEFGRFRLIPSEHLLLRDAEPVPLAPKVFDTLLFLVERSGSLVEKSELLDAVWADSFVEEATLARNVSLLRKVLEADGAEKYIETVPKRGYRFTRTVRRRPAENKTPAAVEAIDEAAPEPVPETPEVKTHRPVLWLTLVFVAIAGIVSSLSFWNGNRSDRPAVKSIAVMPFRQLGGGDHDRALELGMADAVITRVGKIRQLVVRPLSAVSRYLDDETDAVRAGRELQTDAVLEGTVQREQDRVRVTARLIETAGGAQLWAENFDSKMTDIFTIQDSISAQIAQSLNLKLSGAEKNSLARRETADPEAYQLYLKGRYFWNRRTPDDLSKALRNFEQAIVLDPNYALAYTGLADCYVLLGEYRVMVGSEAFSKARSATDRALELDPESAEARCTRGYILAFYDWNFAAAEKEFKQAIEQNPNYATAHQWYGEFLQTLGRFDESLAEYRRAEELDPLSLIIKASIAGHFYSTRQYDKSIEQAKKILEMEPNFGWAYGFLWFSYNAQGQTMEAIEAHWKSDSLLGCTPEQIERRRAAFQKSGARGYWLEWLDQANNSRRWQAIDKAVVYLQLGDREKSLQLLEQAFAARERWILNIKTAPIFDPLRDDPRFQNLIRRIGF